MQHRTLRLKPGFAAVLQPPGQANISRKMITSELGAANEL